MSWTKRQFIYTAFEELGFANYVFSLAPEQIQAAARRLDALAAEWNALGIRIGYPISSNPKEIDIDQATTVPDSAVEALYTNLAVRIAPMLGKQVSPDLRVVAKQAKDALFSKNINPPNVRLPSMPFGAGYKARFRNYTAPPDPTVDAGYDSTIELGGGEIADGYDGEIVAIAVAPEPPAPPAQKESDLSLVMTSSAPSIAVGANVSFTITVFNFGVDNAQNTIVTLPIPAELEFAASSVTQGSFSNGLWEIGVAAKQATHTAVITCKGLANGYAQVVGAVSSDSYDPNPLNNSDSANVEVIATPYNLVGVPTSSDVTLTWDYDEMGATFDVYRRLVGDPLPPVAIATGLTAKTYVDATVSESTNYLYSVESVLGSIRARTAEIQVDTLAAYDPDAQALFDEFTGTPSEKLKAAINNYILKMKDPSRWDAALGALWYGTHSFCCMQGVNTAQADRRIDWRHPALKATYSVPANAAGLSAEYGLDRSQIASAPSPEPVFGLPPVNNFDGPYKQNDCAVSMYFTKGENTAGKTGAVLSCSLVNNGMTLIFTTGSTYRMYGFVQSNNNNTLGPNTGGNLPIGGDEVSVSRSGATASRIIQNGVAGAASTTASSATPPGIIAPLMHRPGTTLWTLGTANMAAGRIYVGRHITAAENAMLRQIHNEYLAELAS